jgi:5'-nucleotidase / UDP-sugar diphosphatase
MLPGRAAEAPARRARTISLFHTTDLHGHIRPTRNYDGLGDLGGLARIATQLKRWRAESPNHLVVDIGDLYQGTPASFATRGRLMIELLNHLGYDAWVPGNHDFDWGREVLEQAVGKASCTTLCANLSIDGKAPAAAGGVWEKVLPWTIREVGGLRIALVGLTTPGLPSWLMPETLGGLAASDPLAALRAAVAAARAEKPDALVVLGHMGWKFQDDADNPVRSLLREVKGIDVYLGGHSHQDQPSWVQNGVLCSQASYHGIHCGRVDLTFDLDKRRLVDKRAFTLLMDDRIAADDEVMRIAGPALRAADEEARRVLAELPETISARGRGSPLWALLCEAFAAELARAGHPVDAVFHGTFGSGDIPAGTITVGDCWRIIPYENLLVVAELSAAELAEIVAEDATVSRSDRQLSDFEIGFDPQGRLARLAYRGEPVEDPQRRFRIAFNSYDSQSGGGRLPVLHKAVSAPAARRLATTIDTRGALIAHLGRTGVAARP